MASQFIQNLAQKYFAFESKLNDLRTHKGHSPQEYFMKPKQHFKNVGSLVPWDQKLLPYQMVQIGRG